MTTVLTIPPDAVESARIKMHRVWGISLPGQAPNELCRRIAERWNAPIPRGNQSRVALIRQFLEADFEPRPPMPAMKPLRLSKPFLEAMEKAHGYHTLRGFTDGLRG